MNQNALSSTAEYIARWGNPGSLALLDPACKIFSTPGTPGIIGYRLEYNNVIVFSDPLCPPEHLPALIAAFHAHFNRTANIIYAATSASFAQWILQHHCKAAISFGNEIIIDPRNDPRIGSGEKPSQLRRKYNNATKHDVQFYEYTGNNPTLEKEIEDVGTTWIKDRKGPQIYLQHVDIFADQEHKRYFYAQRNGKLIGILILNRLDAFNGWVLSFLMVIQDAPKGTSEFIVISALAVLAQENCSFFSVGSIPGATLDRIEGLGKITTWFARNVYLIAKKIFHLDHRLQYWKKFRPIMQPTYLLFQKPHIGIRGALGIMHAFNAHV